MGQDVLQPESLSPGDTYEESDPGGGWPEGEGWPEHAVVVWGLAPHFEGSALTGREILFSQGFCAHISQTRVGCDVKTHPGSERHHRVTLFSLLLQREEGRERNFDVRQKQ